MASNTNPYRNPYSDSEPERRRSSRQRAGQSRRSSGTSYRDAAQAHRRATPRGSDALVLGRDGNRDRGAYRDGYRDAASADYGYARGRDERYGSYGEGSYGEDRAARRPRQDDPAAYSRQAGTTRYASEARSRSARGSSPRNARAAEPPQFSRISANAGVRPVRGGGSGRGGAKPVIIGVVVLAALVAIGVFAWSHRSVEVTLNGNRTSIRIGSTVEQVVAEKKLEPKAGNLISVSGKKLEDGMGYPYMASLDGNELDGAATEAYRVKEGDALDISDGRDRTEDYDVQVVEEQPKLEMGGDAWGNITYISQWGKVGRREVRTGKRSGETADGDVLQETQNTVVSIHQIKPDDGRKLIALTFDDGPAEKYTEAYLGILDKYGIKATFFNLGQNIQNYPELAKKIVDSGNELMSHTDQHQNLPTLEAASLQQELTNTFSTIQSTTGVSTTSFRPPYGAFTEETWLRSGGTASLSVLWNLDSLDWKRPGVDAIVSNCTEDAFNGSIILMHDGGGNRDQDIEALPQIIEKLQSQGYTFVTVGELMKSDSSIPQDIASGNATMPSDAVWPTEIKK